MTAVPAGTWRAIARGWPVFVPVISWKPACRRCWCCRTRCRSGVPGSSPSCSSRSLALLAAVWLTVGAASAAVDGTGGLLRRAWRRP